MKKEAAETKDPAAESTRLQREHDALVAEREQRVAQLAEAEAERTQQQDEVASASPPEELEFRAVVENDSDAIKVLEQIEQRQHSAAGRVRSLDRRIGQLDKRIAAIDAALKDVVRRRELHDPRTDLYPRWLQSAGVLDAAVDGLLAGLSAFTALSQELQSRAETLGLRDFSRAGDGLTLRLNLVARLEGKLDLSGTDLDRRFRGPLADFLAANFPFADPEEPPTATPRPSKPTRRAA